ncbi:MAG: glucose-1-phosphate adenylyltransferase [bacterium]
MLNDVIAVILGGGRGTRLLPLTLERAKPAVSFAGKYRLIDIPISNSINSGINRIFVLTQFMSASLHRHVMQTYQFDLFRGGLVDLLAAEQTLQRTDWFQGTADAVRATLKHTLYYRTEQMLILSGDHLYRMNYADLIRFHREKKADVTLCVYPVTPAEAPGMGLLKVDESGAVQEFVEKPEDPAVIEHFMASRNIFESQGLTLDPDRCLASMGIYVFESKVLTELLADQAKNDFGHEVIPSAIGQYRVMAYPFSGYWKDIGTIATFFEANLALLQPEPPFSLYWPRWPFYTRNRALPPSRIVQSRIIDSLVVEGSEIKGAHIIDSIVGMRGVVRKGSRLDNVVMLGADFYDGEQVLGNFREMKRKPGRFRETDKDLPRLGIGRGCQIERAIIDKNVRIGDEVIIRAKPEAKDSQSDIAWVRDGITIIPKGAVIPSGTRL